MGIIYTINYYTSVQFAQRRYSNNAWNFNGTNGNLNNNNVNNTNSVWAVSNLSGEIFMMEELLFREQMLLVFNVQKNKRRGHDSLVYENNIIALTLRGMYKRLDRTLRINHNYAFLVSIPKWREIVATEFEGRKIDHEVCDVIIPLAENVLSPYTFNNRKGKGTQAAINQLIEHIAEVSKGYTHPIRVIKIDFKGFFPSASCNYAEKCLIDIIDNHCIDSMYSKEYIDYIKWLIMIAIHCNPASHCEFRSPKYLWEEHIEENKSILHNSPGIGAAIGRLIWQTAMGLYINDILLWLTEKCGIKIVCFVDDIVMIVPEERHQYALSLIPRIREKLKNRNVRLNDNKFYDQPLWHGVEFLGSHIKPYRIHINNSTYNRALQKIILLNKERYKDIDAMVSSFNSYSGLLKNRTDYKRIIKLKNALSKDWWKWLEFDERKLCLVYKELYSVNARFNRKYHLKIKKYDTTRNRKPKEYSVHKNDACRS